MRLNAIIITLLMVSGISVLAAQNPVVVVKTSMGEIEIELFRESAPQTVANFLKYAGSGFYNGTIFHRVIGNFMIQGGGMTPDMREKQTFPPVYNEAANGLSNKRGTIAMARRPDPHSATSQFFINVADNNFLDYKSPAATDFGYCVFGRVVKGMDVVDKIRSVPTGNRMGFQNVPLKDVFIQSIKVKK